MKSKAKKKVGITIVSKTVKCNDCNTKILFDKFLLLQGYCEECFYFKFPDGFIYDEGYKVKRKNKKKKDKKEKLTMNLEILGIPKSLWLPDNGIYVNRFYVKSDSSDNNYIISQNSSTNYTWGCSCPGWKRFRKCKHLKKLGLIPAGAINTFASGYTKNAYIPTAGEIRASGASSFSQEETSTKVNINKRKITLDD